MSSPSPPPLPLSTPIVAAASENDDVERGSNPTDAAAAVRTTSGATDDSTRSTSAAVVNADQMLQRFLSQVGIAISVQETTSSTQQQEQQQQQQPQNQDDGNVVDVVDDDAEHSNDEEEEEETIIFESFFDLTEERLTYVFQNFDTDKDGRISYDSLRRGLEFHAGLNNNKSSEQQQQKRRHSGTTSSSGAFLKNTRTRRRLDDATFEELVRFLDADGSGDISFPEFKEGIRLLMLRACFAQYQIGSSRGGGGGENNNGPQFQLLDYDANRLERRSVGGGDEQLVSSESSSSSSSSTMKLKDFFFQSRPEWVKTRWINVPASPSSALTLQCLAIKYSLHPLAIEDALSPETHRPKAESFSNHYFLMVPVMSLLETKSSTNTATTDPKRDVSSNQNNNNTLTWRAKRFAQSIWSSCRSDSSSTAARTSKNKRPPVPRIAVELVSIFVNVPKDDTIITFHNNNYNNSRGPEQQQQQRNQHPWTRVQRELEKSYSKLRQYDAQYVTYALLDQTVDLLVPIVSVLRKEIVGEREYLLRQGFRDLKRVHKLRKELEKVARKLKPFTRLVAHVIEDPAIVPGATVYLSDVQDNLECIDDDVRQLIADCEALDTEAEKTQSRRMDRTLYTLTVVSAVFLPAQFITGVYGMNFLHMPELDENWAYPGAFWGITAALIVILLVIFNCGRVR